jgi:hypothetical protein
MPTSGYNKFLCFVADVNNGVHDFAADQLTVALTNAAHAPVNTNTVLANITEIAYTNCSTRNVTLTSSAQSSGTYKLLVQQLTLTASGGDIAPFRYVILYNSTASGGPLIAWWDYTDDVTVHSGETFLCGFDTSAGVFQLA